jgi:hypothetical protein
MLLMGLDGPGWGAVTSCLKLSFGMSKVTAPAVSPQFFADPANGDFYSASLGFVNEVECKQTDYYYCSGQNAALHYGRGGDVGRVGNKQWSAAGELLNHLQLWAGMTAHNQPGDSGAATARCRQ